MIFRKFFLISLLISLLSFGIAFAAEERFDTNVVNANLITTLQGIALKSGKNIVINGDLKGTVTIYLKQKTVSETLEYLGDIFDFNCTYDGNVIIVSPSEYGNQSKAFQIKHADLAFVKSSLMLFIPEKKISASIPDSSITIHGTPAQIAEAEKQIALIDIPQQQIVIKVKIVQINQKVADNLGLNWVMSPFSLSSAGGTPEFKWAVTPNIEKVESKGKILAEPSIATINGREAKLSMGQSVPLFTTTVSSDGTVTTNITYQDVGIFLITTPRVNDDGTITCQIKPTIKIIEQWVSSGNAKAPQISTREAQTVARVQSGKTIIIGGLIQDNELKSINSVPALGKLPFFGALFRNKNTEITNSEVFIFITPEIVDDLNTATINAKKAVGSPFEYGNAIEIKEEPKQKATGRGL